MTQPGPRTLPFTKGHGTQNDFVLIPDLDGTRDLSADDVRYLADRRAGLGGDGVIRVAPTAGHPDPAIAAQVNSATWFMDYRNADGSIAEMCGNGTRVFAAYLVREGLESAAEFAIATRAGTKVVRATQEGYAVGLGSWTVVHPSELAAQGFDTFVHLAGLDPLPGLSLDLGNPHVVVALPDHIELADLDLTRAPDLNPAPASGANVEFVHLLGDGHLRMRVFERGVGETRSCGTGAAAAALAAMLWSGQPQDHTHWQVDVPGGTLQVSALPGQSVELSGPAALIADGQVTLGA